MKIEYFICADCVEEFPKTQKNYSEGEYVCDFCYRWRKREYEKEMKKGYEDD